MVRRRSLPEVLAEIRRAVDRRLPGLLRTGVRSAPALTAALDEAVAAPGKRIRASLVVLTGRLFRGDEAPLLEAGCAVEMVHAASLALDDLPAMDDALLRRGRPALHRVHGEDAAILAAVTLLSEAFFVLTRLPAVSVATERALVAELATAIGALGLSSGQMHDLRTGSAGATFDQLETIHAQKTGALFVTAASLGARLAAAREAERRAVESYAKNLGLAFQIVDDLLEAGDPGTTGKRSRREGRPTFARHVGVEGARRLVAELTGHAVTALDPFGGEAQDLSDLAILLRDRVS